jgi:predicted transcriptional regulator
MYQNDISVVVGSDVVGPSVSLDRMGLSDPPLPAPHEPAIEDVLGPLGAAVMRFMWSRGEAGVVTVVDAINTGRPQPLAYTTVMTIMGRLYDRGLLVREKRGRQFIYRPSGDEGALLENMSARAVDDLLARFGTTALRQFAARLADVDPELQAQVQALAKRRSPR